MEIDIENLPQSTDLLQKIIVDLRNILHQNETELASYKEKYIRLLEELRLEKQQRFSPSSEKNILQPDIFDEAAVPVPKKFKSNWKKVLKLKHIRARTIPSAAHCPRSYREKRLCMTWVNPKNMCLW